jgi:cellulose synthase/poly-beta-1,6-N-acetylglucosamine synthase-like glycosyltransferase
MDRNLYQLGEDRTLTIRMLEQGYNTQYEPRAIAYTECPNNIVQFILVTIYGNTFFFVTNLFCSKEEDGVILPL